MSVAQLEKIPENPDLIQMATEQMQNLKPKQYESTKGMLASGASGVLLVRWWRERGGDPGGAELFATEHEVLSLGGEGYEQSELGSSNGQGILESLSLLLDRLYF